MIRCIQIGNQITLTESATDFAFFDTINWRFMDFGGEWTWDSREDFEQALRVEELITGGGSGVEAIADRCLALLPAPGFEAALVAPCPPELAAKAERAAEVLGIPLADFVLGAVAARVERVASGAERPIGGDHG
jgi:hypothetical protein